MLRMAKSNQNCKARRMKKVISLNELSVSKTHNPTTTNSLNTTFSKIVVEVYPSANQLSWMKSSRDLLTFKSKDSQLITSDTTLIIKPPLKISQHNAIPMNHSTMISKRVRSWKTVATTMAIQVALTKVQVFPLFALIDHHMTLTWMEYQTAVMTMTLRSRSLRVLSKWVLIAKHRKKTFKFILQMHVTNKKALSDHQLLQDAQFNTLLPTMRAWWSPRVQRRG